MKQYDIWLANLPTLEGKSSVMRGTRPVLIVSNDKANEYSPVITAVPLTSKMKKGLPTQVKLTLAFLAKQSTALCEQVLSLDKNRLVKYLGTVKDTAYREEISNAMKVQLNMQGED